MLVSELDRMVILMEEISILKTSLFFLDMYLSNAYDFNLAPCKNSSKKFLLLLEVSLILSLKIETLKIAFNLI